MNSNRGFTLIELIVAISIATLIAAVTVPTLRDKHRQKISDVTANEIYAIAEAAQNFSGDNNGAWPDQAANCANALNTLTTNNYLSGIDLQSPWGTTYSLSCPETPAGSGRRPTFRISVNSNTDYAEYIARSVPAATFSGANTVAYFPQSWEVPALDHLLHRLPDSTTAPNAGPLNTMQSDIQMAGVLNAPGAGRRAGILGAGVIEFGRGSAGQPNAPSVLRAEGGNARIELGGDNNIAGTGQPAIDFHFSGMTQDFNVRIINNADNLLNIQGETPSDRVRVRNQEGFFEARDLFAINKGRSLSQAIQDATIVSPNQNIAANRISKPVCVPDQNGVARVPQIFVAGAAVTGAQGGVLARPISAYRAFADDFGSYWLPRLQVLNQDSGGVYRDANPTYSRVLVFTKCT